MDLGLELRVCSARYLRISVLTFHLYLNKELMMQLIIGIESLRTSVGPFKRRFISD